MSDPYWISAANAQSLRIRSEQNSNRFWCGSEQPTHPFLRHRKTTVKTLPNVTANDTRPGAGCNAAALPQSPVLAVAAV